MDISERSTVEHLPLKGTGLVDVTVTERGEGPAVLVLHGGAGPQSTREFADLLAATGHRVVTPVHPGFGGTPRAETLTSVRGLAALYAALLDDLDLTDVTVVGNSVGGWIAAELALLGSARVARVVLLDATGIEVPGHPVADVSTMPLVEILALTFHDARPFLVDPALLPAAAQEISAGNRAALEVYAGGGSDPSLLQRLAAMKVAALVVWGESDGIVDQDYGRSYADAIPGAQFLLLTGTGHAPQVETPDEVVAAVRSFVASHAAWRHIYTVNTTVAPEDVWATLRDLYTGRKLSERGDDIVIHGPFAAGTELSVTPNGADFVVHCTIVEIVEAAATYAYRSNFNGLYITSRHRLTRLPTGGTRVTQHSEIAGPRAETVGPDIGPRIVEDHPEAMTELLTAAATRTARPSH